MTFCRSTKYYESLFTHKPPPTFFSPWYELSSSIFIRENAAKTQQKHIEPQFDIDYSCTYGIIQGFPLDSIYIPRNWVNAYSINCTDYLLLTKIGWDFFSTYFCFGWEGDRLCRSVWHAIGFMVGTGVRVCVFTLHDIFWILLGQH